MPDLSNRRGHSQISFQIRGSEARETGRDLRIPENNAVAYELYPLCRVGGPLCCGTSGN